MAEDRSNQEDGLEQNGEGNSPEDAARNDPVQASKGGAERVGDRANNLGQDILNKGNNLGGDLKDKAGGAVDKLAEGDGATAKAAQTVKATQRVAKTAAGVVDTVKNIASATASFVSSLFNPATWIAIGVIVAVVLATLGVVTGIQVYGKNEVECSTTTASAGGDAGELVLEGTEEEKAIAMMTWLMTYEFEGIGGKPFTKEQAAGIAGNVAQESSFNPSAVNPNGGASGLFQWLGGRKTGLQAFASENGKKWDDPTIQMLWLDEELSGADAMSADAVEPFRGDESKSAEEWAEIWATGVERHGPGESGDRIAKAKEFAKLNIDGVRTGASRGGSNCDAGGAGVNSELVGRLIQRAEFLRDHSGEVGTAVSFMNKYGGSAEGIAGHANNPWAVACPNIVGIIWGLPPNGLGAMGHSNAKANYDAMKAAGIEPAAWAFPGDSSPGAEISDPPPGAIAQATPNHTFVVLTEQGHIIDNTWTVPGKGKEFTLLDERGAGSGGGRSDITGWVLPSENFEGEFLNDQDLAPLPDWATS